MKITKTLSSTSKIRNLTSKEKFAGNNIMQQCLMVKPADKILIVTDPKLEKKEAAIFFESAKQFTDKVKLISFTGMTDNAQEPPKEVAKQMANSDVVFLVTDYSLSHTQARKNACQQGARIASLPGITQNMIIRTLSGDYSQIDKNSLKLTKILSRGSQVTLTSPGGTDLTLTISNRKVIPDKGINPNPGDFCNLPAGEVFVAPLEEKTNGTAVFDGAFADIELDKPIKLIIKKGMAVKISGGQAAKKLKSLVNQVGPKARIIAELGIGTNPTCQLSPNVLEAEKVYGTAHLALGNNATFGGKNSVPFHSDGIILNPLLKVDGKTILKDNKIVI
jgi:leucyl aminopeptidase (aminopeptidase T)